MLPPILYHYFPAPFPYFHALALQEKLHKLQLLQRKTSSHKDVLLLLQHRPVYTAGRRQTESSVQDERRRLTSIGADFVTTMRGGQITYHGPGQLVGYPLLDLSRTSPTMSIREYICRLQKMMELHLRQTHGIDTVPSEHTGVFIDPTTKIGSIGVQVRHRLTSHGFALNITREPLSWFNQVVACGLDDVKAGSVETATGGNPTVEGDIPGLVGAFGQIFEREMLRLNAVDHADIFSAISELEPDAGQ
jgi:lipoate-protein ligase B